MNYVFSFNSNPVNDQAIDGIQSSGEIAAISGRSVEFVGTANGTSIGSLFIWDFGDENGSNALNPNIRKTSSAISPVTHFYSRAGKYVVRLIEQRKDGIILESVRTIKIFA